ncbi:unnamed protein product [Camellia sinensis]
MSRHLSVLMTLIMVVPETFEPSLQLAATIFAQAKLPMSEIAATINEFRSRHLSELTTIRRWNTEDKPILPLLKKEQPKNRWDDEDENDVNDSWADEEETALIAMLHDVLGRLFATLLSYGFMLQVVEEDSESSKEDDMEGFTIQGESEDANDKRHKRLGSTKMHTRFPKGSWRSMDRDRVVDNPITEARFVGIGVDAAYYGLRPVVVFTTFNFSMQAIDHIINFAAKSNYMSAGAQHSLHGMWLYGESFPISAKVLDSSFYLPIGKAKVEREGKDVMITTFSRMGYAIKNVSEFYGLDILLEISSQMVGRTPQKVFLTYG